MSTLPIKFKKDDLIYMITLIVYCLVMLYSTTNNDFSYEFIEYLLEYIHINYPNTTYDNISSKHMQENFIEHHDITWQKLYVLIKDKYTEDEKNLMVQYMMEGDVILPEHLIKYIDEIKYYFEYGQATFNSNKYVYSGIRYKNDFREFIKKIIPVFTKYNFKIKELDNFLFDKIN